MKISIIIPSYNSGKYIRQAIDSVLSQDCDVECIVIDGKSDDGSDRIIGSYGDKIKWISEPDDGETSAINKGLKMATGNIVGWLDADDIYLPGALELVLRKSNHIFRMWFYGKCKIIDEDSKETSQIITKFKEIFQKRYSYDKLLVLDFIAQPATFWRRELLDEIGYLDETENLVMDYEYWLRIGARYQPVYIDEYLACWRSHGESSTSKALVQDMKDALRVARKYSPGRRIINVLQWFVCYFVIAAYFVMGRR